MRHPSHLLLSLIAFCGIGGCDGPLTPGEVSAPLEGHAVVESGAWTVAAMTPTLLDDDTVEGRATFERLGGAEGRGGGVCLVAEVHPGVECHSDAECAETLGPPPAGGFHYCVGINNGPHKRCWTRPDNNCLRSRDLPGRVLAPGEYASKRVSALVDGRPVKWMTLACLAIPEDPAGCGSADPARSVKATSRILGPRAGRGR